jgi:hypothetical protein
VRLMNSPHVYADARRLRSSALLETPSFRKILARWTSTVLGVTESC